MSVSIYEPAPSDAKRETVAALNPVARERAPNLTLKLDALAGSDSFGLPFRRSLVIDAPGAQVEIASAAGPVDIPVALADFDIANAAPDALGTVEFVAATALLSGAGAVPAGSLMIRSGDFVLSGGSSMIAQNESAADAVGPVDIAVSGELRLLGNPSGVPQTLSSSICPPTYSPQVPYCRPTRKWSKAGFLNR